MTQRGDADTLFAELQTLKREITEARNVRYTTPAGGHDDLATALGYAVWGLNNIASIARVGARTGSVQRSKRRQYAREPSPEGWT